MDKVCLLRSILPLLSGENSIMNYHMGSGLDIGIGRRATPIKTSGFPIRSIFACLSRFSFHDVPLSGRKGICPANASRNAPAKRVVDS